MLKTSLAATIIAAALATEPSVAATFANQAPLDALALGAIRSNFGRLMELANRHDLKALHEMFWTSPSVLLVAKSATPSEGNWAGFWGNDAVDQKLHDIAASGPVELVPDMAKLKIVGLTPDVAEFIRPTQHHRLVCGAGRDTQTVSADYQLAQGRGRLEDSFRDHSARSSVGGTERSAMMVLSARCFSTPA